MKNIFNKIAKIEENANEIKLAKHEVNLGLIDDFKSQAAKSFGAYTKATRQVEALNKSANDTLAALNEAGTQLVKVNPLFQDIEKAAKDLGLDLPNEVKQEMKMVKLQIQEIDSEIKRIKKLA